jgi:NADH dehydrogenase
MTLFITGASRGIGRMLIDKLTTRHEVYVLTRHDRNVQTSPRTISNLESFVNYVHGNLTNPQSYSKELSRCNAIIHLAAATHTNDVQQYYTVNVEGTKLLCEAAQKAGIQQFIHISTRAIGANGGAYSDSKDKAEYIIRQSNLNWTIIRPSEVYGVIEGEGIAKIIRTARELPFMLIPGDGSYKIAPVHVADVIGLILRVIDAPENIVKHKIYNAAGPEEMTYLEFVDRLMEAYNIKKMKLHIPFWVLKVAAEAFALSGWQKPPFVKDQIPRLILEKNADISLAVADFGYAPHALNAAMLLDLR